MYLPYLMIGYSAAILLGLLGCRVAARALPGLPGVRLLSWGLAAVFAGMVLYALRPVTPLWVTSVVANETILVYYMLLYAALAQCLGVPSRVSRWGTGLLLAQLAANLYFSYGYPSLTIRFLVTSLFPAVCSVSAASLLFRRLAVPANAGPRRAARRHLLEAIAWLQVTAAVSAVVRSVLTVLYPPTQVMELDLIQSAFTYLNLLYGLGAAAGLLWLAFLIHREDLYTRANTDGLTGLLNRRAFDEVLARELDRAEEGSGSISVIMADIDFFKRVNDMWGHPAGDEVIREVGFALRRVLRPSDRLCRFGGEEFAIVLPESSLTQAGEIAERLRAGVAALARLPGDVRITVSLGLAASSPGEKPEQLIQRCDQALYRSKREGRNRVSIAADMRNGELDPNSAPASPSPRLVTGNETQRSA
jgi:diguanylate cyclase (GGDEF)-like protein